MHQPIYKDSSSGKYLLPWVRLHALKGYTDLPFLSEKYPDFRQTINFTPSLLVQLEDYISNPDIKDDFLELTKKSADTLSDGDKQFILKNFYMNNLERVIHPHARYNELFHKRGVHFIPKEIPTILNRFTIQDFLDLQVLFNLMWFGFSARKLYPRIDILIKKGRNFTEEEKKEVIELQYQVMKDVLPRLKKLAKSGQIELSCSPFYHPILPLLVKEGDDELGFSWQEDAKWQIEEAQKAFERLFEVKTQGVWPSEGSVSESAARLMAQSGVRWIATDEEILLQSLKNSRREQEIYEPHHFFSGSNSIQIFFRDKALSDLIGFGYHRSSHFEAVDDLIRRLHHIQNEVSNLPGNHVVSIILDGENPWEFYPNGGESFLTALVERLRQDPRLKTITFSDYLDQNPNSKSLNHLHAGSWINHNFNIWYKHPEDLMAWKYLEETRKAVKHSEGILSQDTKEKVWKEIFMAEASDWYWWFGDEFFTETGDIFDYLFRSHLIHAFQLLKKRPPAFLRNSIKSLAKPHVRYEPQGFVNPILDGKVTYYYEWANAGLYQREHVGGAMFESSQLVEAIYYGFNLENLFIRLDFSSFLKEEVGELQVLIHIHGKQDFDIQFQIPNPQQYEIYHIEDQNRTKIRTIQNAVIGEKIVEIKIPFHSLNLSAGDTLSFSVTITKNDIKFEEWPRHGLIQIIVPGKDYEDSMWSA